MEKFSYALLQSKEQMTSSVMINGVPQGGQIVKQYFIQCQNCNRILGQFNPGDPLVGVIETCKNQVAKDLVYCPTCGSKLIYPMDIIDFKDTSSA